MSVEYILAYQEACDTLSADMQASITTNRELHASAISMSISKQLLRISSSELLHCTQLMSSTVRIQPLHTSHRDTE